MGNSNSAPNSRSSSPVPVGIPSPPEDRSSSPFYDQHVDEQEDLRIYTREQELAVRHFDPPCPVGWPGKIAVQALITKDMLPVKRLLVELTGRDQGPTSLPLLSDLTLAWGNTGFSKVTLIVLDLDRNMKASVDLGIVYHENRALDLELDKHHQILAGLSEGDQVGIWAVSAPYGGYECVVSHVTMTLEGSFNWRRRADMMMFLYHYGYRECLQNSSPLEETKRETPMTYSEVVRDTVLLNSDLTRHIALFL